ncbi:unnamed protein product [Closterium sp. NIES-53]
MLGSATPAAVGSGGADAAAISEGNGSGWVNIPLQPMVSGQPPVEEDVDGAYVPTAEEVAAAAADSAGENEVEVVVQVEQEGVGETSVGCGGGRSARGRGRGRGRTGRVQGRSSEGATAVHGENRAGGTSRGGRGGGRVGSAAQGGGDGRAEGSASVEAGPSRGSAQCNDGGGGTPVRAAGTSRGGGTSGGRPRRTKRPREVTPTDPVVEELAGKSYSGLLVGMFGDMVDDCRACRKCGDLLAWGSGNTSAGWRHVKRKHYPNLQIWVRRFLDPAKPGDLQFPLGGYGRDGKGPVVPDGDGAWEHAASWPNIPATAMVGTAEGVGGGGDGGIRAASMSAYITPRVQEDELRSALVELFADADLPFRLVDRPSVTPYLICCRCAVELCSHCT